MRNPQVLRWSWHKWVDLRYVDALACSDQERKIVLRLAAESDLLLVFSSQELYDKWNRGLRFLLSELLGDVEMHDMDAQHETIFARRHSGYVIAGVTAYCGCIQRNTRADRVRLDATCARRSSLTSDKSGNLVQRVMRAVSASFTLQDPYERRRKGPLHNDLQHLQ